MSLPVIPDDPSLVIVDPSQLLVNPPFKKDISLGSTYVAGTMFIENMDDKIGWISEGSKLKLRRQPDNQYDRNAIEVLNDEDERIGYIPRKMNVVLANLMDSGKSLYCRVTDLQIGYDFTDMSVEIMMEDI